MIYTKNQVKPKLIHEISDELAVEMKNHLVPMFKSNQDIFETIDISDVDIKNSAYTWVDAPRRIIGKFVPFFGTKIMTFHEWAYYGFFKPSLYEVFCGIYWAFQENWKVYKYFWLDSEKMNIESIMGDYHFCKCVLWKENDLIITNK